MLPVTHEYHPNLKNSALFASGVFLSGVVVIAGEADGRTSRTGVIILGFLASFACMLPVLYIHDLQTIGAVSIWCLLFRRADGSANLGDPYGYSAKQRWRT
jgi:hypothetical protein